MRFLQTEYLLKGIFLALVVLAALLVGGQPAEPARETLMRLNLCVLGGFGAALLLAGVVRIAQGFRTRGRLIAFVLFLLLESPILAYLGILGGMLGGLYLVSLSLGEALTDTLKNLFVPVVLCGAVAGFVFGLVRQLEKRLLRIGLILALAGLIAVCLLAWLGKIEIDGLRPINDYMFINESAFAWQLLLGLPFFYVLTFAGHEEESEVEIGLICGVLGLGLFLLFGDNKSAGSMAILLPLVLYFGYTLYVLPGLRVMKHAFRGLGHARSGKFRKAMQAFRRALQLDPNNRLARDGFWEVHRSLNIDELLQDPQALALLDLDLCLSRAGTLLLNSPTPASREEALRLLELILRLQPERKPQVDYWHAVAFTHAGRIDDAATLLTGLLDSTHYGHDNPARLAVLLPAWQLALLWHGELRKRVGEHQMALPGRRMEAIAALERYLGENPEDPSIASFKELLYRDVHEAEYDATAGEGLAARHFDHAYVQQLGLSLINDDARWQRGGEYLRLAARGLPTLGPTLFVQIAQAQQRAGLHDEARHNFELAKRAGQAVGQRALAETERAAYFATVKALGEDAMARNDLDGAVENFRLFSESERSGIETLRVLAELYERKGDPLAAARVTDQALQYNGKDPDLLERKDRYYYSILPSDLKARLEHFGTGFDVDYCIRKSKGILSARQTDLDWLDVAHHLTQLALVIKPESRSARVMLARILLRIGERDRAVSTLEEVRGPQRPERFAGGDDEEAWYEASQFLGDLYLELDRADLAVPCLNDYRKSAKAGARTWFKLAQAYEALGNPAMAKKCYEQVAAYEGNPLAPEAEDALMRLRG